MLEAVQRAFYAENRDVTKAEILADVAARVGIDREDFLRDFGSDEAAEETWTDFAVAKRAGITKFPTLLAGAQEGAPYAMVTQGFQPAEAIISPLERWLRALDERSASPPPCPDPAPAAPAGWRGRFIPLVDRVSFHAAQAEAAS